MPAIRPAWDRSGSRASRSRSPKGRPRRKSWNRYSERSTWLHSCCPYVAAQGFPDSVRRDPPGSHPPFVPDQHHHEGVEYAERHEAGGERVGKAIHLVDDEKTKHDQRDRISPHLVAQEPDHQQDFDQAVAEQIDCIELLAVDRK